MERDDIEAKSDDVEGYFDTAKDKESFEKEKTYKNSKEKEEEKDN